MWSGERVGGGVFRKILYFELCDPVLNDCISQSPRDSGSPLACASSNGPSYLQGLFSHGFHCGSVKSPVYYTDLNHYGSWIASRLQELLQL